MENNELKQKYANFLYNALNSIITDYENKGYVVDLNNSSPKRINLFKMKGLEIPKAKVSRILITENPEFSFEVFLSQNENSSKENIPAFKVFTATHTLPLSELTEAERDVLKLPATKRIQERAHVKGPGKEKEMD